MMLRICVVGSNQDPSKPVSMSLYIAHRACTAFAGNIKTLAEIACRR